MFGCSSWQRHNRRDGCECLAPILACLMDDLKLTRHPQQRLQIEPGKFLGRELPPPPAFQITSQVRLLTQRTQVQRLCLLAKLLQRTRLLCSRVWHRVLSSMVSKPQCCPSMTAVVGVLTRPSAKVNYHHSSSSLCGGLEPPPQKRQGSITKHYHPIDHPTVILASS